MKYTVRTTRRLAAPVLSFVAVLIAGCSPGPDLRRFDPIPMDQAAAIVNDNIGAIAGTLRATGSVDGHFTNEAGRRRSFHLDGTLFMLAPHNLRFDIKSLAGTELLFGSNDSKYWYYGRQDGGVYYCFCHDDEAAWAAAGIPVGPLQIIEAMGLTPIPHVPPIAHIQRIVDDYQQLLFLHKDVGQSVIEKEYWLDRRAPRLVRRVIFRDRDGVVTMDSAIGDYRRAGVGEPLLPRRVEASWASSDTVLTFTISKWRVHEELGADSPQFIPPHELGLNYERMVTDTHGCED